MKLSSLAQLGAQRGLAETLVDLVLGVAIQVLLNRSFAEGCSAGPCAMRPSRNIGLTAAQWPRRPHESGKSFGAWCSACDSL